MIFNFKLNFVNLILNYLIINQFIDGLNCLKCYKCASSNLNSDLNCGVEQKNKFLLKTCSKDKSTCVHVNYKGVDPKTGSNFFNIVRECSSSNTTGCTVKKKKNLNSFVCFCKGDGCNNKNSYLNNKEANLIQLLSIVMFTNLLLRINVLKIT